MVDAMAVPFVKRLETAHTVRAAPRFLGRKFLKAFGKMLPARVANLLAAAILALISVQQDVVSKEPRLAIVQSSWRRTERAHGDLLTLTLLLSVTR